MAKETAQSLTRNT